MRLYRTIQGILIEQEAKYYLLEEAEWDALFFLPDPALTLAAQITGLTPVPVETVLTPETILPPLESQEVWAAGVTYYRSRDARMEEAKQAGGEDFYARVYEADRPELFIKATPHRVVGHLQGVRIRQDSRWNVPEPELTLAIDIEGRIFGVTIGNDMSSRDIEGENPLYLPQAKVYDQSCALGPCLLLLEQPLPPTTEIRLQIVRGEATVFAGATSLAQMRRTPQELAEWLFRENTFPEGCFLMTGTGIVPPSDFTLESGDIVHITIEPIGTLINPVM